MFKIYVLGSNTFSDKKVVFDAINEAIAHLPKEHIQIVTGDENGVCEFVREYAKEKSISLVIDSIDWYAKTGEPGFRYSAGYSSTGKEFNRMAIINRNLKLIKFIKQDPQNSGCILISDFKDPGSQVVEKKIESIIKLVRHVDIQRV